MRLFFLTIVCTLLQTNLFATTYYVAANGNNNNNGTSITTPFQTIDKVNAIMSSLVAGDQVLFRRGDTFRGQITVNKSGTSGAKIVFGAYGSGDKPIISGAKLINAAGWTSLGNSVWQVSHADAIHYLFINGNFKMLARYPNSGYLAINSTNGATSGTSTITNSSLTEGVNYWNGARIHVRNQNDAITYATVSAFSGGTLSFPATGYQILANYGFYLDNTEKALDTEGEWFWNSATNILKIKSSSNPSATTVEGSFFEYGIKSEWSASYLTFQDLEFRYQRSSAINIAYSNGISVQNCTFRYAFNGIDAGGYINTEAQNLLISGNEFYDIFNNSIKTNPWTPYTTITQNTIRRNALIAGYEGSCLTCGQAMYLTGNNTTISYNTIEDCGYAAINYTSANNLVEKNIIKNTGLTKNDCGAIQSWGSFTKNNTIRHNFCSGMTGNVEGTPAGNGIIANAIYLDNYQAGSLIENNTCYNSPNANGFFFYSVRYNTIQHNTAYNNEVEFGFAERNPYTSPGNTEHPDSVWTRYNTMTNNIAYSLATNQLAIKTETENNNTNNFGTFNNNKYFNPYIGTIGKDQNTSYTLSGWQTATSRDASTQQHWLKRSIIESVATSGSDLITNGNFGSNITGWSKWQGHVTISHNTSNSFGSNALEFLHSSGGSQTYGDLQSNNLNVATSTNYILRFKGYANTLGSTTMSHRIAMAVNPYSTISSSATTALDNQSRNYYWLFTVTQNQNPARLIFTQPTATNTIFLDDVSLYAYSNITYDDPSIRSPIFINPTNNPQIFNLTGTYRDLDNNIVTGSITVPAWSSKILVKTEETVLPVAAKVYFNSVDATTGLMPDYLKTELSFPKKDPYRFAPLKSVFVHKNNNDTAQTNTAVLAVSGNNAIVDWVFLELRTGNSGATSVAYTKSALLQSDGDIVDMDGVSPISFNAPSGNYYLAIRHRNHIGFRTANKLALNGTPLALNFTNNTVTLFGATPLKNISPTVYAMNVGDANFDGSIDAFDTILWENQNGLFDDYTKNADYNLDGSVDAFDSILWEINNGKFEELD